MVDWTATYVANLLRAFQSIAASVKLRRITGSHHLPPTLRQSVSKNKLIAKLLALHTDSIGHHCRCDICTRHALLKSVAPMHRNGEHLLTRRFGTQNDAGQRETSYDWSSALPRLGSNSYQARGKAADLNFRA